MRSVYLNIKNSRKCWFLVPELLKNSPCLAPANNTIISCNRCTIGSCQVDGGVAEGGMPGQDAGHHGQARSGVPLGPAGHRFQ